MEEHLLSMHEALGLVPRTRQTKKGEHEEGEEGEIGFPSPFLVY